MKARIYHRLNIALLDLGLGDAFVSGEEALLESISQIYARELLELRSHVLTLFPDALIEREKLFRSKPMYLSLLVLTSSEKHQIGTALDQMRMDGQIAAWEDTDQEKYPNLRWLLKIWPRTLSLPHNIQGYVLQTKDFGSYQVRIIKTLPDLIMVGVNDSTGLPVFSTRESSDVITLDFSLDLGERLLLWCYQGNDEDTPIATAMLRLMSHLIVEKEEGIHIQHRDTMSGGVSLSP